MTKVTSQSTPMPAWWTGDEWSTPLDLFDQIAARYGPFDLDPCCRVETAKAPKYFTLLQDGLEQRWFGNVFMNPPYSHPAAWAEKAASEVAMGHADQVVALLPAATDTAWFHEMVVPYATVDFIRGRPRFLGWDGLPQGSPKFGNIIAIYRLLSETAIHAIAARAPQPRED